MTRKRPSHLTSDVRSIENWDSWRTSLATLRPLVLFCLGLVVAILTTKAIYSWRQSQWIGVEPFRFLVIEVHEDVVKRVVAVHYLPDGEEMVMVNVPLSVRMQAVGDYGTYQVDGLWKLGKIEGLKERLLARSVEHALAVLFDRVVVVQLSNEEVRPLDMAWGEDITRTMMMQSMVFSGNVYDAARVWWRIKGFTDAQMQLVDLATLPVVSYTVDVDGMEIGEFDLMRLDDLMRRTIMPGIDDIAGQGVVIENATAHSGLATHWSRFVVLGGYDLVNITDTTSLRSEGALLFDNQAVFDSLGGQILRRWFPDFLIVVTPLEEYRSDIVVRLGEESWQRVHGREEM